MPKGKSGHPIHCGKCATNRVTKACENRFFGVIMCRVESQLNY
jgi:hypothetical protein